MPLKLKFDIWVKDPTPGTLHRQPDLLGTEEVAVDVVLEPVLVVTDVAELTLVEDRVETEDPTLHTQPVVEAASP